MEKKYIPIGFDDFKEIIKENYYFVDKSLLIAELLEDGSEVIVLPRPRRFGKTLNLSMLKYFFDIRDCGQNRKLFNGLKIESSKQIREQGKYPVIYISFKDIKVGTWGKCLEQIKEIIAEIYKEHLYLREVLDSDSLVDFDEITSKRASEVKFMSSLARLTKYLNTYYKTPVIVLIDEYDTPLIEAHFNGYFDKASSFFRNLMSATFKSNIHLKMGVMTGIVRIASDSIFSELNNIQVGSILDDKFNHFGFTTEEVEELIKYYGLENKLIEVEEWYRGYQFGGYKVYNPWSIINFASNDKLFGYWIDSSSNSLIKDLFSKNKFIYIKEFKKLFSGESTNEILNDSISFSDLDSGDDFWSLLFYTGYLTYIKMNISPMTKTKTYQLVIPNYEVLEFFRETFLEDISGNINTYVFCSLIENLYYGNIDSFSEKFKELFRNSNSYHDSDNSEKGYHNFVLGLLLYMSKYYVITSNYEAESGCYNIIMTPRMKNHRGIIFQFNTAHSPDKLKEQSQEALKVIEEKDYTLNMKSEGVEKIIKIGIAFSGKELEISYRNN